MILVLPGLDATDGLEMDPVLGEEVYICPLTLHNAAACESRAFLREMLALCDGAGTWRTVRARALLQMHQKHWPACQRPIRIVACGHVFAALPLLYSIMHGEFRCPLCRGGSNRPVHLTRTSTPGICSSLWELMCLLCTEARRRTVLATLAENEAAAREMQGPAPATSPLLLSEILELMSLRAIFSIYRADTGQADAAGASVVARSCPVSVMVLELHRLWPPTSFGPVVLESGTSRHVSRPLRLGGVFTVRIVADAFDQTQTLFDSHRIEYPRHASGARAEPIDIGVPGENDEIDSGHLRMKYEICPYDHKVFLKSVYFTSTDIALRDVFSRF